MSSSLQVPDALLPYLTGQLTDDSSLQTAVVKCNIVFLVVVLLSSGLRMFVRFYLIRAAGLDDILMILAVLFATVLCSSCLAAAQAGMGKHIWNLNSNLLQLPDMVSRITKLLYVCYISYATAITFTKCAIIASYLRIFPHQTLQRVMFGVGFVVIAFWIASVFSVIFTCVPIQAAWDYSIQDARCFDVVHFFYVASAFNIATDIVLCAVPMPLLWSMNLPLRQRCIVCVLFGLGVFACIASILRITQLYQLGGVDVSYQSVGSLNWSVAEVGTAILCASLSSLRPLMSKIFPKFFSYISSDTPSYPTASRIPEIELASPATQPAFHGSSREGIPALHRYETNELKVLPRGISGTMREFKSKPIVPFEGRSSNEGLVRGSQRAL